MLAESYAEKLYIYIYIYMCVCVCVCVFLVESDQKTPFSIAIALRSREGR